MGHERIGFLPRRESWTKIVNQLAQFSGDKKQINQIADQTLEKIQTKYKSMPNDDSVIKAIKYLLILSFSAKSTDQTMVMKKNGINIKNLNLYELASCAKEYVMTEDGSLETNQIARDALLETIVKYEYGNHKDQLSLFDEQSDNVWTKTGNGAAFCELARGFIASFTERYLKYFLERESAHVINDYELIKKFTNEIAEQTKDISQHAFETSKPIR